MKLIDKDALVAEIERRIKSINSCSFRTAELGSEKSDEGQLNAYNVMLSFIDTLEVKEVDLEKERMSECPYRQVVCTMYEGKMLECKGACSWVVDYPKLKELKAQKGENI